MLAVANLLVATAALTPLLAQDPTVRAVCAPAEFAARNGAPAWRWLCDEYLPQRPEWPQTLAAGSAFVVTWSATGLRIEAAAPPPTGTAAAGCVDDGQGCTALWSIDGDGIEDWFVPNGFVAPPSWLTLLGALRADALSQPRTLDIAVLLGHLAPPQVDGDPLAALVRVGGASCGEATWTAWRTERHLRVRGRSGGGLLLPAALLVVLDGKDPHAATGASLRAFVARDGDRSEAVRRLLLDDERTAIPTLRAMLLADDEQRLAAIDALVRRGATTELPRIVAAATGHPLAAIAAHDAVGALLPNASARDRQATRAALLRSDDVRLRSVDFDALIGNRPTTTVTGTDSNRRVAALAALLALGSILYVLWLRERRRLAAERAELLDWSAP
ncbi:MAG: hypothetical protein RL398_2164 [Planctomycetota bacterium]